ncbi:MAG: glycosyltransferase [Acidobacteria bacterium]|nr:glycosyltransferase [Acidobacteriota bacterium]
MRVITNLERLGQAAGGIEVEYVPVPARGLSGLRARMRIAMRARSADFLHLDCEPYDSLWYCILLPLVGARRVRLVLSDLNLQLPKSQVGRLVAKAKGFAFRRVDLFLLLQHDFSGYRTFYALDPAKVRSLPFKVNSIELIQTLETGDSGWMFAGGSTHRDWPTLAAATRDLDLPLRIGIPDAGVTESVMEVGPTLGGATFSEKAVLIRHPPRPIEWLRWVASSKFVCLPIRKESLNPSGISTYLSCMALGKCVLISDGPAVRGFLDDSRAVIVPPGDPAALRSAIERLVRDPEWRESIARRGQEWALSLGGEESYYRTLLQLMGAIPETGVTSLGR